MGECIAENDLLGDAGVALSSGYDKLLFDCLGDKVFSALVVDWELFQNVDQDW